jgi:hypothetical protein
MKRDEMGCTWIGSSSIRAVHEELFANHWNETGGEGITLHHHIK